MKLYSKPLFGLFAGVAGAALILSVSYFTSWGKDGSQPALAISSTPVNRTGSSSSYAPVVKKAAPSVVNIYSSRLVKQRLYRNPMMDDPSFRRFYGNQPQGDSRELTRRENWLGSGIIVTPDGYILTANHVVDGADEINVGISNDKTEYAAKVIGKDPATDIAVLKIDAKNLPAVMLGDSSQLEVGDVVLAIGNPFGIGLTVTHGIISALGRSLPQDRSRPGSDLGARYQDFIQTDASINQGNSGGALVDAEGRLIGINDAIVSPSGTSAGIGFAVPVNMARKVMQEILNGGKVTRGYLGIIPQDIDANLAKQFSLPGQNGALVGDVMPGTPAAKAGLKSGDVILSVNGKDIADAHDLQLTISQCAPGTAANLKVVRNGIKKTYAVNLAELPGAAVAESQSSPPAASKTADALDGVTVADLNAQVREQLRLPEDLDGAFVTDVDSSSNAAEAGLQPNDVIVEINRQPVAGSDDAVRLCKAAKGGQILVKVWRRSGDMAGTRFLSVDNTKRAK